MIELYCEREDYASWNRDYIGNWRLLLCWLDLHLWQPQSVWEVLCLRNEIFNMYVIVGILVGVIITLICILGSYMRQVKDICRQLRFLREHESNMLITKEIKLGNIKELTDLLNEMIKERKKKLHNM